VALGDWVVGIYPEGSLSTNFGGQAIMGDMQRGGLRDQSKTTGNALRKPDDG
jgi:hypothetical protein